LFVSFNTLKISSKSKKKKEDKLQISIEIDIYYLVLLFIIIIGLGIGKKIESNVFPLVFISLFDSPLKVFTINSKYIYIINNNADGGPFTQPEF